MDGLPETPATTPDRDTAPRAGVMPDDADIESLLEPPAALGIDAPRLAPFGAPAAPTAAIPPLPSSAAPAPAAMAEEDIGGEGEPDADGEASDVPAAPAAAAPSVAAPAGTRVVGRPRPHDSAALHVTGAAAYIDDIPEPAGTLHVAPGGSPRALGRIVGLDLAAVVAAPGVVAVLTHADVPGRNDCSASPLGPEPVFAEDRVEFHDQVVFAVVATSRDAARRAARLARIEIEAETPFVDVDAALLADQDLMAPYEFRRGHPELTIAGAPRMVEGTFRLGGQEHFYLEPQIALATPREGGEMHVFASTQGPTEVQHVLARVLGRPDAAITVEVRRMGGGFGGKESQASQWAAIAAVAATRTGRPCKIRLDRDADFTMTGKRHDFRFGYKIGFSAEGVIEAVDTELAGRCGFSPDLSLPVNDRAMFHADNAYFYPHARIHSRRLKTNTVSNTAFRGFGGPQGMVLAERMLDAVAYALDLDPLDVRLRNLYGEGRDLTPYGMKVEDVALERIMRDLARSADYAGRRAAISAFNAGSRILRKGLALTPVKFGISFTLTHMNQAGALVHVYSDGSILVNHGGTEMGQGLYVKVAQVVAEEFGVDLERVRVSATVTDKVPNTAPTAASSGTDLNGMAARAAARAIRARMAAHLAKGLGVDPADVVFSANRVSAGGKSVPFAELARAAWMNRVSLSSTGFYRTPRISWDRPAARGRPFYYFACGAACSEVTIDTMTGELTVDRVDILHDVGNSINPAIDIGQIEGGFVQGMGWLTSEELVFDADGRLRTHAPSTYKIPTASDVPADFNVALFDGGGNREETIHRSKAVGEPPLMLAISVWCAIANAIASIRPGRVPDLDAPATPEAIMRAVRAQRAG